MSDNEKNLKNYPKMVTLHCSATDDSMDYTAANIDSWHKKKGWSGIGYHYIIRKDGMIEKGRHDFDIGAHVKSHNKNNIGICWIGLNHCNEAQRYAILYLYHFIRIKYGIQSYDWHGHYEWDTANGKTCPNLPMDDIRDWLEHSGDAIMQRTLLL